MKSKLELEQEAQLEIDKRQQTVKALEKEISKANYLLRVIEGDGWEATRDRQAVISEKRKLESYLRSENEIISKLMPGPSDDDIDYVQSIMY